MPQSLYSGSVWDRRVKMTNMEVRVEWSMALSNGKGLLKKGDGERYKHASRFHSVTFEVVSFDHFLSFS